MQGWFKSRADLYQAHYRLRKLEGVHERFLTPRCLQPPRKSRSGSYRTNQPTPLKQAFRSF